MVTAAIICEYNPFHTGHLYQINKIKEVLKADRIICLMSGDFVERGEPAILSKQLRARMAIDEGADLVLLLPISFATASADVFAFASVSLLNKLGVVDYLCFGAECGNLDELTRLSDKLSEISIESEDIRLLIKEGMTYGEARARLLPEYSHILKGSNNILALEYLNSLRETKSAMKPFVVPREGSLYNDESINNETSFQSATALRKAFEHKDDDKWLEFIPESARKYIKPNYFVFPKDFDSAVLYALSSKDNLEEYAEVSPDLALRIKNELKNYVGLEDFSDHLKTRNFTRTRINRALLHILLNIKGSNAELKIHSTDVSHIRVLGFKKQKSSLLKDIKDHGAIHLSTKVVDDFDSMNEITKELFELELSASSLYDRILSIKSKESSVSEYSKEIYIS